MKFVIAFLLSLNPGLWQLQYNNRYSPVGSSPGEIYFDFPQQVDQPGSEYVNYLRYSFDSNLTNSQALRVTFSIDTSGFPIFGYHSEVLNNCAYPAHLRFFFESKGLDKRTQDGDHRWWSNQTAYELQSTNGASVSLIVNLDPSQWSNERGQAGSAAPLQFAVDKRTVKSLGFSFDGGCFFGHGVNVHNGNAVFTMTGYEVLP